MEGGDQDSEYSIALHGGRRLDIPEDIRLAKRREISCHLKTPSFNDRIKHYKRRHLKASFIFSSLHGCMTGCIRLKTCKALLLKNLSCFLLLKLFIIEPFHFLIKPD